MFCTFVTPSAYIEASAGSHVHISLTPIVFTSDQELKDDFKPETRGCKFNQDENDNELLRRDVYSRKGCMFECITEAVVQEIGCLPPTVPSKVKVC